MVPGGHVATAWQGLGHCQSDTVPVMELGNSAEGANFTAGAAP